MNRYSQKIFVMLAAILTVYSCVGSVTEPLDTTGTVIINYPINQTVVYASGLVSITQDTTTFRGISINAMSLHRVTARNDTLFYRGTVHYCDVVSPGILPNSPRIDTGSTDILITVDRHWILQQNIGNNQFFNFLLKSDGQNTNIDTTAIPTDLMNQFPMYPRVMRAGSTYSILRPGNNDEFIGVFRKFQVREMMRWQDNYSTTTGLRIDTQHYLEFLSGPITIDAIVDGHGVVVSQIDYQFARDGQPYQGTITRRIRDFGEALPDKPLMDYVYEVVKNGLELVDPPMLR